MGFVIRFRLQKENVKGKTKSTRMETDSSNANWNFHCLTRVVMNMTSQHVAAISRLTYFD